MHFLGYFLIFFVLPFSTGGIYLPAEVQEYGDLTDYLAPFPTLIIPSIVAFLIYSILFRWSLRNFSASYSYSVNDIVVSESKLSFLLGIITMFYVAILLKFLFNYQPSYILHNFDRFAMEIRNGSASVLNIMYTIELLPLLYCFFSRKPSYFKLAVLFTLVSSVALVLGARTIVVTSMVAILLVLLARSFIGIKTLSFFLLVLVSLFLLASVIRMGGADGDLTEKLGGYLSRNSDQFANTAVVSMLLDKDVIEYQKGSSMQDALYYFTPRAIYPDKPVSYFPSRLVYGEVAERTGRTFNFGIIGRSLIDFSFTGAIVLVLGFYFFLLLVYRYIRSFKSTFLYVYLTWLYSHLIQMFILGVNSHFVSVAIFNLCVLGLYYYTIRFLAKGRSNCLDNERIVLSYSSASS
jgi:oligosaccharide repeat unit polymerase